MTWTGGNDVPRPRIWGNDGVELTALTPSLPRPDSRLRGNDGAGAGYDGHVRVDGGMTWVGAGSVDLACGGG